MSHCRLVDWPQHSNMVGCYVNLTARGQNETVSFSCLREVFAKANEEKSGDVNAGIAATSARERVAAKRVLAGVTLQDIYENPVILPEKDSVSRVIYEGLDNVVYTEVKDWTVAELRETILSPSTTGAALVRLGYGLTSEMIAAVCKLMGNLDLVVAASKIRNVVRANSTLGLRGRLSERLQPNHPYDSVDGVVASIKEGLSFGAGDALVGINPVIDTVESVAALMKASWDVLRKWNVPTQNCVLAHITTQMKAVEHGARADVLFQSLAGTQKSLEVFGISVEMLDEAYALAREKCTSEGPNVMYFETGQGSELSANAHYDCDQLTLEARCYGLARRYQPFMVNTVVGFIGPEYLKNGHQVTRAGLEDHFMGKLHGLSMGCDVCYTNHMDADQNDNDTLAVLLATAGVNFVMGLPMGDDCMLNYQSTSFHDVAAIRETLGLRPTPEFEVWLENMGLMLDGKLTERAGDPTVFVD